MTNCRHLTKHLKSKNSKKTAKTKPEQVFYVWNYLEWGGAQVYFLGIAARIKDRTKVKFLFPVGTDKQFINFCDNLGFEYEFIGIAADLQPADSLRRKVERHWNKIYGEFYLLKFLQKFDLESSILHIELTPWQSVAALILLCFRAKVFVTMHNALPPVSKWRTILWKLKFRVITRFQNFNLFASNQNAKDSLKPFVSEIFFQKVKVTFTNVNPDEVEEVLKSVEYFNKFDLPPKDFKIFCLGQFIDRKGRWTFLEAARNALEKSLDMTFIWISNSVLTEDEKEKILSFDLGDKFRLIESAEVGGNHSDLMKFLRNADVFTLPSFVEGLPISLLEAMALKIPVISTNVYAIPEAVKDNETGILIEAGNSKSLADGILKLKNDVDLRKKLAENGQKWVLANFNEKSVAEIAFENYKNTFETTS